MTTRDLSANVIVEDLPLVPQYERAHGITLGLAFTILYPLGTILIRVLHNRFTLWIHAICQMVGFGLMIAGLATGQRLANILDKRFNNAHTIVGAAVIVALLLQPWTGLMHHRKYKSTGGKTQWTHAHVWFGRLLIFMGIINGGLGIELAKGGPGESRTGMIVYIIAAAVGATSLLVVMIFVTIRDARGGNGGDSEHSDRRHKVHSSHEIPLQAR